MVIPVVHARSPERLRSIDAFLQESWADRAQNDARLAGLDVEVTFDRGVAHLHGQLADHASHGLVRDLVGQMAGVLAVWSRVRVAGRSPLVVDLGCGGTKQYPDNVGFDLRAEPGVDAIADLSGGLPMGDDSVDVIFAVHILEHLVDFLGLIDEAHRVLRPHGVLHVISPWWGHVNAVADPTHVRLLDVQTFKGICRRPGAPGWYPLHVGCDGASVFADLTPLGPRDPRPAASHMSRFFD